jgi:hypothetical protein
MTDTTDENKAEPTVKTAFRLSNPSLPIYNHDTEAGESNGLQGFVLARVRRPSHPHAQAADGYDETEHVSNGYVVALTADAEVTERGPDGDERKTAPQGSQVWVDETWELRPLVRFVTMHRHGEPQARTAWEVKLEMGPREPSAADPRGYIRRTRILTRPVPIKQAFAMAPLRAPLCPTPAEPGYGAEPKRLSR